MSIKSLYASYQMIFNTLSFRERALICIAAVALIFVLWRFGLWNSLQRKKEVVSQRYTQLKAEMVVAKQTLQIAQKKLEQLSKKRGDIASLLKQQTVSSEDSDQYKNEIIGSRRMVGILKDLLLAHNGLVLQEMRNLPVEVIGKTGTKYLLYKHSVLIRFKGRFFATMRYLEDLERLRWKVLWSSLNYRVEKYPIAEVTLQIHTLSDSKEWINV